jgi:hypothetical protein
MINVGDESLITYAQAATLVPPNGVDRATISRWASLGIRGAVLKSWKIGGLRYTSHESLARFLDECNRRGTLGYQTCVWSEKVHAAQQRHEQSAEIGDVTDDESAKRHGKLSRRAKESGGAQPDAGEFIPHHGPGH